jgi:predicted DNA-binding protein
MKQFTMKMDDETRKRLEILSNNTDYKFNLSKVIRDLINKAYENYAKN